MTTTSDESNDSPTLAAFAEVTREGAKPRTATELDQGLDALLARIAVGRARRRRLIRWSLAGATATLCILVGLQVASSVGRRPATVPEPLAMAYRIEGGSVVEGGYLREAGHGGIKLFFNEGSKLVLMPGTRGRLRAVDKEGARVAIEHGAASFQVTQSSDRRWLVEVGPFLVTVKGTAFTVRWDPSSERFELSLRRGRVVVSGPVSGGDIALRAGQRLTVNLGSLETLITEEQPDESFDEPVVAPAPPTVAPPASQRSVARSRTAGPATSAATAPSTVAKVEDGRRWADALASGDWDRILDDVERVGVETTLNKATSEDLFALANAARYRRRTELARAALLAERRRFPDSPRSLDATFLLGRVEESRERGRARAIAWYDEYLASTPSGAYAAEALGRKMTLTNELGGPAEARPLAEEYLRRFPRGSYAGSARALHRAP
jgi:TolA-binding protein